MDSEQLHKDIKNLLGNRSLNKGQLEAAERAAFFGMAHFLDLPSAQVTGDFAVTSGTYLYDADGTVDAPIGAAIDRVTSAVFYSSSIQNILNEWRMRAWMHNYHGRSTSDRTDTPEAFVFYNNQFYLFPEPNLSGTVYYAAQRVLTDIEDFPDSYFPLMVELVKMHLADPETWEAAQSWKLAKQLIKSFKGPVRPKKDVMELSTHRMERMRNLNALP